MYSCLPIRKPLKLNANNRYKPPVLSINYESNAATNNAPRSTPPAASILPDPPLGGEVVVVVDVVWTGTELLVATLGEPDTTLPSGPVDAVVPLILTVVDGGVPEPEIVPVGFVVGGTVGPPGAPGRVTEVTGGIEMVAGALLKGASTHCAMSWLLTNLLPCLEGVRERM